MRKLTTMFVAFALASAGAVTASSAAPHELPRPAAEHSASPQASHAFKAKINALLKKNPHGGKRLTAAIQRLLAQHPEAISDVISESAKANTAQALAIEQGVMQAQVQLKFSDPASAQQLKTYLENNKSNEIAANILKLDGTQTPDSPSRSNTSSASGSEGGSFAGVNGTLVSPH